jgi:hypothetical protein
MADPIELRMTIAEKRAWERRAKLNRRTIVDELAYTLEAALKQGFPAALPLPIAAAELAPRTSHGIPSSPVIDSDDDEVADWMIDTKNQSGYKGVHQNGRKWRTLVPDPKTGYSIRMEGFETPRAAALARQRHLIAHGLAVPHRGRRATAPERSSQEAREAHAIASGLNPEQAKRAVKELDDLLGGKYYEKG